MNKPTYYDFRTPPGQRLQNERRDGDRARRKEDLALLLGAINLKMMADQGAPRDQLVQQIDYLHDLVDQIMQKHRPPQDGAGTDDTDAADEHPQVA